MRQVREVLRLKAAGISGNEIARRVGVAPSTVRLTLKRLAAAELSWPLPAELTDAALEARLFTAAGKKQGHRRRAEPDWAAVHRELKRKHVALQILWDEYIEQNPDGMMSAWCTTTGIGIRPPADLHCAGRPELSLNLCVFRPCSSARGTLAMADKVAEYRRTAQMLRLLAEQSRFTDTGEQLRRVAANFEALADRVASWQQNQKASSANAA